MRVVNGLDTLIRDFSAFAARSENVYAKTPTASVAGGAKHLSKTPFCPQKARILSLCATADLAQIPDLARTERILRYALLRSVCGQSRGAYRKRFFGRSSRRRNAPSARSAVKRASFRKIRTPSAQKVRTASFSDKIREFIPKPHPKSS